MVENTCSGGSGRDKGVAFRPMDLRIDAGRWQDNMIVGNPSPVFSWAVQAVGKNKRQSACRIQVESREGAFWDSGWIEKTEQSLAYGGAPLSSAATYTVFLTVRDNDGEVSERAGWTFTTALFEEWPAEWIAPREDYGNAAIYFHKRFSLTSRPVSCILYACGIGYHKLFLNGQPLDGDTYLAPAFSAYHKCCYYTAQVDLQDKLETGENGIGIVVAPGWRRNEGEYLTAVQGRRIPFMGQPQLTAVLVLTFGDGSVCRVTTDESWLSSRGPVTYAHVFHGEIYDARLEDLDWYKKDEGEGAAACRIVAPPCGNDPALLPTLMRPQELEPIRVGKSYRPVSIASPRDNVYIFDFGQNLAGVCEIRLPPNTPEGRIIILRHAERLDEKGELYTAPLRTAKAEDTYITGKPADRESRWEPAFTYHGFRYVEVTGLDFVPDSGFITARAFYNAVDNRSRFVCGSGMINQLQDMIVATERANLHGLATDCPQRDERMGWMNDATVRFEELPYNFDTGRLFPKIVRDIRNEQRDDGAISCTAPFIYGIQPTDPVCSAFLIAVEQAYLHQGNIGLMKEAYPWLRAWNECLASLAADDMIDYTIYGDWASPEDCCMKEGPFSVVTPGALLSTGYFYFNAVTLARFAEILGMQEEVKLQKDRAEKIRMAFVKKWLHPDGRVGTGSQGCQAFALWLGILPEERRPLAAQRLHEAVVSAGYRLTTGNLCTLYLMDMLAEYGYIDDAWAIVTREDYPSWGYMMQQGATTLWERFELKKDPAMNSHCHPMYGAVGAWFYTHLAGVKPVAAAFSRVVIKPFAPDKLTFAEAVVDTCKGDIVVKWQRLYGKTMLFVTIPFGVEAEIHTPSGIQTVGSGFYVFEGEPF